MCLNKDNNQNQEMSNNDLKKRKEQHRRIYNSLKLDLNTDLMI